ncbi:MAG TPA: hypothetical protein VFK05_29285 [Polyangiaceae bacterium]|nr:hypothetical protein [Polyangiaceae bacterium]
MLKTISATLMLVLCTVCRLAGAQTAYDEPGSSDYRAPATASSTATGVNAAPQSPEPSAHSEWPPPNWYGGQLLISDAVTLSVFGTGIGLANAGKTGSTAQNIAPGFLWAGTLGYVFAPATIHVVHGRPGIALASASLRFVAPLFGAFLGTSGCRNGNCGSESGPWVGLTAGILLASLLDAGAFAYDRRATTSEQTAQFGVSPFLSSDGKRGELRVFGTF